MLRDQNRLALRQDQHAGRKAELRGAAGEIAEQHERVVVQPRPGAAGLGRAGLAGTQHVVGSLEKIIAYRLGGLRVFPHHRRIATYIAQWQQHAQLHGLAPYSMHQSRQATCVASAPPIG